MSDIEFFGLVDNAYIDVPFAGERKSNYINLPNSLYDPIEGQRALVEALETTASLERFGFDGGGIN